MKGTVIIIFSNGMERSFTQSINIVATEDRLTFTQVGLNWSFLLRNVAGWGVPFREEKERDVE